MLVQQKPTKTRQTEGSWISMRHKEDHHREEGGRYWGQGREAAS